MSGETEERLTITAAMKGDAATEASLAGISAELDKVAKNRTAIITVDDKGSISAFVNGLKPANDALDDGAKKSNTFATSMGKIKTSAGQVVSSFVGLIKVPAMFAGIGIAVQGVIGLIPILTAGVFLLGNAFLSLGAVIGVATLGLSGIVTAVQAGSAFMKTGASAAQQYATAQRQVSEAALALKEAQQDAAKATQDLANAQQQYAEAPVKAANAITDARLSAAQAALSEKEAVNQLAEAQQNLATLQKQVAQATVTLNSQTDAFTGKIVESVTASANSVTQADIIGAQLAVQQAQLGVQQAQQSSIESQQDYNDLVAEGVKGSAIYQDALNNLEDAENKVAGSADSIADAQQRLNDAQIAAKQPVNDYAAAMAKLTPTGQGFVTFILQKLLPLFTTIRNGVIDNMVPGVESGLDVLTKHAGGLMGAFDLIGSSIGNSFASFMQYWGAPANASILEGIVQGIAGPNGSITLIGKALTPLSGIMASIALAVTPLFNTLASTFGTFLGNLDKEISSKTGQSKLTSFFSGLATPITNLFGLIGDLGKALLPLFSGNDSTFNKLVTSLRTEFVPAFATLISTLGQGNNIGGLVNVLTLITQVLTGLVGLNGATNGGALLTILGIISGSNFITGISGLLGLGKGIGSLFGIGGGGAATGGGAAAAGGAAEVGGDVAAGAGGVGAAPVVVPLALAAGTQIGAWYATQAAANAVKTHGGGQKGANAVIQNTVAAIGGGGDTSVIAPNSNGDGGILNPKNTNNTPLDPKWWTNNVGKPVSSFITTVNTGWSNFLTKTIPNAFNTAIGSIAKFFENGFNGAIAGIKSAWTGVTKFFESGWDTVTSGISKAWTGITTGISKAWDGIAKTVGDIWTSVIGGVKNLINGIIGGINSALGFTGLHIPKVASAGATVGGSGGYRDTQTYLLAPGEEVVANNMGQAARHRALLKSINNGTYNGDNSNVSAALAALAAKTNKQVSVDVHMDDNTSVDELSREIAWHTR